MQTAERERLAAAIYAKAHLTGEFTLRSGLKATEYFDKYRFESDPQLLRAIAEALAAEIPSGTEVLAGLELGGVPIATVLAQVTGLPAYFVRKQAKAYGTCRLAEGGDVARKRVLVVEDVATTGGQIVASAGLLRAAGALVDDVLVVIDRGMGGAANLAAENLRLHALFTVDELERAARG
jgi:orotate phosphoribosyltransferase